MSEKPSSFAELYLEQFAAIQGPVGNIDKALSLIRQFLQISAGLVMSRALLKLDPVWGPLRIDARFQKLCEEKQP